MDVQLDINRKNRRRVDADSDSKRNTHEDSDFIEAMDDAFKETYSPRGQVAQQSLHFLGVRQLEQPRDSQLASHHHEQASARSYSPPSPSPFPLVLVKKHEKRMEQTMPGFEHGHP